MFQYGIIFIIHGHCFTTLSAPASKLFWAPAGILFCWKRIGGYRWSNRCRLHSCCCFSFAEAVAQQLSLLSQPANTEPLINKVRSFVVCSWFYPHFFMSKPARRLPVFFILVFLFTLSLFNQFFKLWNLPRTYREFVWEAFSNLPLRRNDQSFWFVNSVFWFWTSSDPFKGVVWSFNSLNPLYLLKY